MSRSHLIVSLALISLLASSGEAAKPKAKKKPTGDQVVVVVTGKLICSHCELGVGDDCCSALQIKNTVFLLGGLANKQLMPQRLNGGTRKVIGVLAKKSDQFLLTGFQLKATTKSKHGFTITGRLKKKGKSIYLLNGKTPIRLTGKQAKPLAVKAGKLAEVTGDLKFDLRGRMRLKPKSAKVVTKKPTVPQSKKQAAKKKAVKK